MYFNITCFMLMILLCSIIPTLPNQIYYLNSSNWFLSSSDYNSIRTNGSIPGDVYTILLNRNIIADPLKDKNDVLTRWVGWTNWTISRTFTVSPQLGAYDVINLVIDGLDTIANVWINGHLVGSTHNMFCVYSWPIEKYISIGKMNMIQIDFKSPLQIAQSLANKTAYPYLPICWPPEYKGECRINLLRKMQASFAWDWGPAIPTSGIWNSVYIEGFSKPKIDNVKFFSSCNWNCSLWSANVSVTLTNPGQISNGCFNITISKLNIINNVCHKIASGTSEYTLILMVSKSGVKPWWPNTIGVPNLYVLSVTYNEDGHTYDSKLLKAGFRTVELVQENIPQQDGLSYYLKVNKLPIFLRGSNYIPAGLTPVLANDHDRMRFLLTSAKVAGMNILRVWGGGRFESDYFYSLADEMGLMLWQDLLFACANYPSTPQFLDNIKEEVAQNIRRLQYHASIVIWAGNNENEAVVAEGWYGAKPMDPRYISDYRRLYIDTIQPIVMREDRSRPFMTSSPSNGIDSMVEGGVAKNPQDPKFGDVHFYHYSGPLWNSSLYPVTRLTSEFGFQSLPGWMAWRSSVSKEQDLNPDGDLMNHRQHHPKGRDQLLSTMAVYLSLPPVSRSLEHNYTNLAYLSQIHQAQIYRTYVTKLRRHQCSSSSYWTASMGALYWQLNDVWSAPTWSSIDWSGEWKMAHYAAKRFFHPQLFSLQLNYITDSLEAHLLTTPRSLDTLSLEESYRITCFSLESFKPTASWIDTVKAKLGCPVIPLFNYSLTEVVNKYCACTSRNNCLVTISPTSSHSIQGDWTLLTAPKNIIQNRTSEYTWLKVTVGTAYPGWRIFTIVIEAKKPGLFVWLSTGGIPGWFSDNGFPITQNQTQLTFHAWQDIDQGTLSRQIRVMNMASVYSNVY